MVTQLTVGRNGAECWELKRKKRRLAPGELVIKVLGPLSLLCCNPLATLF